MDIAIFIVLGFFVVTLPIAIRIRNARLRETERDVQELATSFDTFMTRVEDVLGRQGRLRSWAYDADASEHAGEPDRVEFQRPSLAPYFNSLKDVFILNYAMQGTQGMPLDERVFAPWLGHQPLKDWPLIFVVPHGDPEEVAEHPNPEMTRLIFTCILHEGKSAFIYTNFHTVAIEAMDQFECRWSAAQTKNRQVGQKAQKNPLRKWAAVRAPAKSFSAAT